MQICKTKQAMRALADEFRADQKTIGLVPTMGYLHEGHMHLVRQANADCDRVIVSIYVNPKQFGSSVDLEKYPRDMRSDLAKLRAEGVDAVFAPTSTEMYSANHQTIIETTGFSRILMGKVRPGHFRGVASVVAKLFNICQPNIAYFGEKDYQQLLVIRRMVEDLDMPIKIKGVPTVRENDGLAMSSRNVRLTPDDRQAATILSQSLFAAADHSTRQVATATQLRRMIRLKIETEPRAQVLSVDVRDAKTLDVVKGPLIAPSVALLAVRFGEVLLIDQHVLHPVQPSCENPK